MIVASIVVSGAYYRLRKRSRMGDVRALLNGSRGSVAVTEKKKKINSLLISRPREDHPSSYTRPHYAKLMQSFDGSTVVDREIGSEMRPALSLRHDKIK